MIDCESEAPVSIYKPGDICGNAGAELTPQLYRSWGRALGRQVAPLDKFVVGGDKRASTPELVAALVEGLCQSGVAVVDLGALPTPMIYYAKNRLQAAGCAIVTGSHYPAPINGLSWMVGRYPPTSDDVAALRRAAEADAEGRATEGDEDRTPTTPRTLDVSFDYVACLQERFVDALGAQQHVVLDPMSGCWAGRVRRYLNAIFPQCLFSTIYNVPLPDFAGRTPDCSQPGELHELGDAVYRERAHLGIGFDGDGDRIAVVDNEGVPLSVAETAWVLLQSFGPQLAGQPFVHDAKLSDRIIEAARQLGAEPLVERSGAGQIRARMRQTGALFGVESTGHYFYRELDGGDDSLYTACRLIGWLVRSEQTLADLRRCCPTVYMTPDLVVPLPAEAQPRVIEQIRAAWAQFPQETSDGVRIRTPSGWILLSSAATESLLTFRFEGLNWAVLEDLVARFCRTLPGPGDVLWRQYRTAMGMEEELT